MQLQITELFLVLGPLVPPLGPPFGQGESLHGTENAVLEVRVAALELIDQILDLLPLGVLVGGAAVFNDRQLHSFTEIICGALGDVKHGPDLDDPFRPNWPLR